MLVAKLLRAGGYIVLLICFKLNGELGSTGIQYTVGKLVLLYLLLGLCEKLVYFKMYPLF